MRKENVLNLFVAAEIETKGRGRMSNEARRCESMAKEFFFSLREMAHLTHVSEVHDSTRSTKNRGANIVFRGAQILSNLGFYTANPSNAFNFSVILSKIKKKYPCARVCIFYFRQSNKERYFLLTYSFFLINPNLRRTHYLLIECKASRELDKTCINSFI